MMHITGHDVQSLLFNFLQEWLFVFSTEFFIAKRIKVLNFDQSAWSIRSIG